MEPTMTTIQPPVAFIYDRHATANKVVLQLRLEACTQYVEAQGWQIGGWFLDTGDDALTDHRRPAFDAMLNILRSAGADTPRVVLIHDWDRLSRDQEALGLFTRRILQLGTRVETCRGEQRRPDGRYTQVGRLTGPITA
jgi:DNA invertase Pin-like site-specific DNA recombinase